MTHWTRHEKRLARDVGRKRFGDEGYAMEELVGELGAAFLCADLDLTPATRPEHAAYFGHWIRAIKAGQAGHLHRGRPCPKDHRISPQAPASQRA